MHGQSRGEQVGGVEADAYRRLRARETLQHQAEFGRISPHRVAAPGARFQQQGRQVGGSAGVNGRALRAEHRLADTGKSRLEAVASVGAHVGDHPGGPCSRREHHGFRQGLSRTLAERRVGACHVDQIDGMHEEEQVAVAKRAAEGLELLDGVRMAAPLAGVTREHLHGLGSDVGGTPHSVQKAAGGRDLRADAATGRFRSGGRSHGSHDTVVEWMSDERARSRS